MERALMANYAHHRFYSTPCASSSVPLRLTALSFSLPPVHSPSRLRLFLPSRFPARSSFSSLFLTSLPFLPFPLIPRCPKHSHLPIACISSSAFTSGAGGSGIGPGGGSGGGGGGQGGGDGFVAHGTGTQSLNPESDDISIANPVEDYIFLDVGGMSCGGCASSVKKILESQVKLHPDWVPHAFILSWIKIPCLLRDNGGTWT
ncbi:hypothetical protein L7F22_014088 [Adiantum nelumboides]|nr:hypothetical protein [Adiantum nelumboides]